MISLKNLVRHIKKINRYERSIVRAFVNIIGRTIHSQTIPLVLEYICLLFFYETDAFGESIEKPLRFQGSCRRYSRFGKMDIMNTEYLAGFLYQWRFKYDCDAAFHIYKDSDVVFGITDQPSKMEWYNSNDGHHIGLCKYGYLYKTQSKSSKTNKTTVTDMSKLKCRRRWVMPNDEMIINIDIKAKKMEFVIMRDANIHFKLPDIPIVFASKDHKYRIVVYCEGKGISVELSKFNKIVRASEKIDKDELILDHMKRIESEQKKIIK